MSKSTMSSRQRKALAYKLRLKEKNAKSKQNHKDGRRPCRWTLYGCNEYISVPVSLPEDHEMSCPFKCNFKADEIWKALINYQAKYPTFKPDIWSSLASKASTFLSVDQHDPAAPTGSILDKPQLYSADELWVNGEPPASMYYQACFEAERNDMTVTMPKDVSPWEINNQLIFKNHPPVDASYALNVIPEALLGDYPMTIPESLEAIISDRLGYTAFNITPRHSFVDLHVDRGQDTVAAGLGQVDKIWLLWPPTPHNEDVFYKKCIQHVRMGETLFLDSYRLSRLAPLFEGGMISRPIHGEAIFIPSGWIHAVVTIEGGFLCGISWTTTTRITKLIHCLRMEVIGQQPVHDLRQTADMILRTIDVLFQSPFRNSISLGLASWVEVVELIVSSKLDWGSDIAKRTATSMNSLAKLKKAELPSECPCTTAKIPSMAKHLLGHIYHAKNRKNT